MPPDAARWRRFSDVFARTVEDAGYACIIPPMFEDLGVFRRLGEATDVVTKEMYDFEDKGGRHIALRPEQTASVCRAFAQHRPATPWKVWYSGPNFRYEKAQAGRYRQFDQVGIEVLGTDDPDIDVEVIFLGWDFYRRLGLSNITLMVNSLGDTTDRQRYVDALAAHFASRASTLSEEAQRTLEKNPLRVLDSKRDQDKAAVESAPLLKDFLSDDARSHFARVCEGLKELDVPFVVNDRLVRGLDYYRRTTFEYISTALESAQNAVGGGGRYDGLVEELGGPATHGIGFALGVDRTLLACDAEGVFPAPAAEVDVFIVDVVDGRQARALTHDLRRLGISADRAFDGRSMKSQMKAADRSGAAVAIIIGEDEVSSATCVVRRLDSSDQVVIPRVDLVDYLGSLGLTPSTETA